MKEYWAKLLEESPTFYNFQKIKIKIIFILSLSIILFFFISKKITENYLEKKLSKITEYETSLRLSKFNLFSGKIEIKKLTLKNKKNFSFENIFESEKIIINFDIKSYFSNLVIIKNVNIIDPKFFFEIKNKKIENKNSITDNMKIIDKISGKEKPKIYPKKIKDKNFIIKNMILDSAISIIKYENFNNNLIVPLSYMEFKNVGNSGNSKIKFQHYKDVIKFILSDIFLRIPDKNLKNLIKKNYKIK